MRLWRQFDPDLSTGPDLATRQNDPHHPGFTEQGALGVAVQHGGEHTRLKRIQLPARISQTRHLDNSVRADMEPCAGRQAEQVHAPRGDVFTQVSGGYVKPLGAQQVEQLSVNKVYLPQIGLCGVSRDPRAVFDAYTRVGVSRYAQPGQQANARPLRFAKGMCSANTYRFYTGSW